MCIRKFSCKGASIRHQEFVRDIKRGTITLIVMLVVICMLLGAAKLTETETFDDTETVSAEASEGSETEQVPYIHNTEGYSSTPNPTVKHEVQHFHKQALYLEEPPLGSVQDDVVETVEPDPEPEVTPTPHTETEREMMLYTVELETHDASFEHKRIVACVIINRMYSEAFRNQDTIEAVLTAKNQFSGMSNYYKKFYDPDQDTIDAVDAVLNGEVDLEEVSMGATFFYNPTRVGKRLSSFENRTFLFELEGHRFFK